MIRVLIIEDDNDINHSLAVWLSAKGCECIQAFSGTEGLLLWQMKPADVIVMDLMLPGMDGGRLLENIREKSSVPVIVLSAKNGLDDKINLLGAGADDYMTKPFEMEELWARIQVQLRKKNTGETKKTITFKNWELDMEERVLYASGQLVELTRHEFDIVELLVKRPKKVFTKQEIYEAVWEQDYIVEDKTINVHISNIRAKLRPSGTEQYVQTVWGIGFKLNDK